jgi:hypothetical protein
MGRDIPEKNFLQCLFFSAFVDIMNMYPKYKKNNTKYKENNKEK